MPDEKSKSFNVFIGWSGERSRLVATLLKTWIARVVQSAKPWLSEDDIPKGSYWFGEVFSVLAKVKVGIMCLTPENLQSPWLHFEAGAISKAIGEPNRVCTLLTGEIAPQDIEPPLGMFQSTRVQREDILKLVRTINQAVNVDPVTEKNLDALFDAMWPQFEEEIKKIPAPSALTAPMKRTVDSMVSEILEIVRTDSGRGTLLGTAGVTVSSGTVLASVATPLSRISEAGVSEAIVPDLSGPQKR